MERRLWVAAILAFALHAGEEALSGLPQWATVHPLVPWMASMLSGDRFILVAGALTLVVLAVGGYAVAVRPGWSGLLLRVLAWVMLANAASHVVLSILTMSYMPGLVTAVLVLVPVFSFAAWRVR